MKNVILSLFAATILLSPGCQSKSNTTAKKEESRTTTNRDTVQQEKSREAISTTAPQGPEAQATAELCDCMNKSLADMNPKVRQIIVDAGKSEDPTTVLSAELQKAAANEDQERLIWELERFAQNRQLQQCGESIKQKYKLDERDQEQQQRFLAAAGQNKNCELVYALMRVGLQQENSMRKGQR